MRSRHHFFKILDGDTPDPFSPILPEAGVFVLANPGHFLVHDFAAMPVMAPNFIGPQLIAPVAPAARPVPIKLAPPEAPMPLVAAAPVPSLTQAQVNAFKTGLDQTLAGIESNLVAQ